MATQDEAPVSDKARLLFGAGFVFGVAFAMLVLAIVTATVAKDRGQSFFATEIVVTIGAGIVFTAVVGVGLYYLAFPENRLEVPIGGAVLAGSVDAGETDDTGEAGGGSPDVDDDA
jgi:hypothetical protein